MHRFLAPWMILLACVLFLPSCMGSGSGSGTEADPFATSPDLQILEVTNGFGRLLPHVVAVADPVTGMPTAQLVEIRSLDDLLDNPPTVLNPIKPPANWPEAALNPANQLGNHYVAVRFTRSLSIESVLDSSASGAANHGLTGAISLVTYDPETGQSMPVPGRGFIDGRTFLPGVAGAERWVRKDGPNQVQARSVTRAGQDLRPGVGFPGTDDAAAGVVSGAFQGAGRLVSPDTFVFVADSDGDLSTYESFPSDGVLRLIIKGAETGSSPNSVVGGVRSRDGKFLEEGGIATSGVGTDRSRPSVLLDGLGGQPVTLPKDLASDQPCDLQVRFSFSEACQPYSLGPIPGLVPPSLSNEFTVEFLPPVSPGSPPPGQTVQVPYTVMPVSPFDFTTFHLTPIVPFPGSDPFGAQAEATVTYFHHAAVDLLGNQAGSDLESTSIRFSIGNACPGMVNVPVAPGAIVMGSNGGKETGGIRVMDLDGFGQGTGDPTFDADDPFYNVTFNEYGEPIAGDVSKFPFNPNLQVPGLFPPLNADSTSIAGGSRGVFTLSQDSTLRTQLVSPEEVGTIADMHLGHPLDLAFNNYDCLSGGRNLCASAALQRHPMSPAAPGNGITAAPHPNPPRIRLSPSCFSPLIQTEEPTAVSASQNTLVSGGDAFGTIGGGGPSGLLTETILYQGTNFTGPAPSQPNCPTFVMRQQVGHFLYVLDTSGEQVVVLNSNRMSVLARIPVSSPRDMAIAPDLNLLAVSNYAPDTLTFIDTDPFSPTFHTVLKTTDLVDVANNRVGQGPTEVVWQPGGEDILVLCEGSDSMAIVAAGGLETRKIIPGVQNPQLLAVGDRGTGYGFNSGLYYAYVVSQSGEMTIFESGPDGLQGIGFDDFVGAPSLDGRTGFPNPSAIMMDPSSLQHEVLVAYSQDGQAAVDGVQLDSAPYGPVLLRVTPGLVVDPNRRDKEWRVVRQFTGSFSSASILDLAVDDLTNLGDATQVLGAAIGGSVSHSGKGLHRGVAAVSSPQFLFAASANGKVDVLDLRTGVPVVQPVRVPGVRVLCHYWRQ